MSSLSSPGCPATFALLGVWAGGWARRQTAEGHSSVQWLTNQMTVLGLGLVLPQSPCLSTGSRNSNLPHGIAGGTGNVRTWKHITRTQHEALVINFDVGTASPELVGSFMYSGEAREKCTLMQSVGWGPRSCNWTSYCILSFFFFLLRAISPPKRWQRGALGRMGARRPVLP